MKEGGDPNFIICSARSATASLFLHFRALHGMEKATFQQLMDMIERHFFGGFFCLILDLLFHHVPEECVFWHL